MLTSSGPRIVHCHTHHLLITIPAYLLHNSSRSICLFTISNSLNLTSNTAQLHPISKRHALSR